MTHTLWWDKKWVLACQSFGECTARVKLELTDFRKHLALQNSKMLLTLYCSLSQIIACIILFSYLIHTNYAAIVIFFKLLISLSFTYFFHLIPIFFYSNMPSTYFPSFWIASWETRVKILLVLRCGNSLKLNFNKPWQATPEQDMPNIQYSKKTKTEGQTQKDGWFL